MTASLSCQMLEKKLLKRSAHPSPQVGIQETKNYKNIFTTTESPVNTKSVKVWFHVFPMMVQEALLMDITS